MVQKGGRAIRSKMRHFRRQFCPLKNATRRVCLPIAVISHQVQHRQLTCVAKVSTLGADSSRCPIPCSGLAYLSESDVATA